MDSRKVTINSLSDLAGLLNCSVGAELLVFRVCILNTQLHDMLTRRDLLLRPLFEDDITHLIAVAAFV